MRGGSHHVDCYTMLCPLGPWSRVARHAPPHDSQARPPPHAHSSRSSVARIEDAHREAPRSSASCPGLASAQRAVLHDGLPDPEPPWRVHHSTVQWPRVTPTIPVASFPPRLFLGCSVEHCHPRWHHLLAPPSSYLNPVCHLNVHPTYGPWMSLRALLVFDLEMPDESCTPPPPLSNP